MLDLGGCLFFVDNPNFSSFDSVMINFINTRKTTALSWFLSMIWTVSEAASASTDGAGSHAKPNIVVLFADDLGYGSVSWFGGNFPTPNIDSIAENGVGFRSGYMTAPVCNPSRPGLMTGRYQQRWGKELNSQTENEIGIPRNSLPKRELSLASALRQLGYATGAVGKWQFGMSPGYHPLDLGFDSFLGMPSGSNFVDSNWPNARIAPGQTTARERNGGSRPRALYRGHERVPVDEYLTDKLGKEGVKFIERHKEEPFFLYLAFHAPHTPL